MKKIYISVIAAVIAICFLFAACGEKDNMGNVSTTTTTTTTSSSASGKTSTTTDKTNMVEDGITKASEEMSEMASEVKSDLSEMQ